MRTFLLVLFLLSCASRVEAAVLINEIAWMGNVESSTNEWIELASTDSNTTDLSGWVLRIEGKKDIALLGSLAGGGYYLVERTDDDTVPRVSADLVTSFGTGLSNDGAILTLLNASGAEVDRVNGADGWKIGGGDVVGDNSTKETAQRNGSSWATAQATPRASNAASVQPQASPQTSSPTPESPSAPPSNLNNFPVDPQIFASAGVHTRTTVVGAPLSFAGKVLGLKKEPIENARMIWSFGDGSTGEGSSVSHVYYYPGEYTVVLDAASGYYSASDRVSVSVSAPSLLLETGGDATRSFVAITNKGNDELDLSLWNIVASEKRFMIPKNTFLSPRKKLMFPSEITGLVSPEKTLVTLQFPNGMNVPLDTGSLQKEAPATTMSTYAIEAPHREVSKQRASIIDSVSGASEKEHIVSLQKSSQNADMWPWYTGVALMGVLGVLALRLGRRGSDHDEEELRADDFEIIEEDDK